MADFLFNINRHTHTQSVHNHIDPSTCKSLKRCYLYIYILTLSNKLGDTLDVYFIRMIHFHFGLIECLFDLCVPQTCCTCSSAKEIVCFCGNASTTVRHIKRVKYSLRAQFSQVPFKFFSVKMPIIGPEVLLRDGILSSISIFRFPSQFLQLMDSLVFLWFLKWSCGTNKKACEIKRCLKFEVRENTSSDLYCIIHIIGNSNMLFVDS